MSTPRSLRNARERACALALLVAMPVSAAPPRAPQPVSPGARSAGARVEARCPTFSWAAVEGASGYELAVFRISVPEGSEPELVTRATLPANVATFTPPIGQCLERGERYAWSVAALHAASAESGSEAELDWAPEHLFEVEAAPPADDVEHALDTLRRCLDDARCAGTLGVDAPAERSAASPDRQAAGSESRGLEARSPRSAAERRSNESVEMDTAPGAPSDRSDLVRASTSAMTPTLGNPSLRVSGNIALGAQSHIFRDGYVFVWGDGVEGNTALGRAALTAVSGDTVGNTAVGRYALQNTSAGTSIVVQHADRNTAVGDQTLRFNSTGFSNTAVGANALLNSIAAAHNTAVGADALRSNILSSYNTAVGSGALFVSSSGSFNTAVGAKALFSTTTGDRNAAAGFEALFSNTTGSENAAFGPKALRANTNGTSNTAAGAYALAANTTGDDNTAVGRDALESNVDGYGNTAIGIQALQDNTAGDQNTAGGRFALRHNTGSANTAFGSWALANHTTGNGNTAFGHEALLANTTGSRNVALGYRAGKYSTGSDNILIFHDGTSTTGHTLRIGQSTAATGVGAIDKAYIQGITGKMAGPNAATVLIGDDGKLGTQMSTRRLKQDIDELDDSLVERLLELRPVSFRYREHVAADPEAPPEYGFIAEEVAEVFPELVIRDEAGRPMTVKYHLLGALLLGELQRLNERLEAVESRAVSRAGRRRH